MTGYIKITAATRDGCQGLSVETNVQDVSSMDRMQVLNALCRSLKFSSNELKLFAALKSAGILDRAATVTPIQDEHVRWSGADLLDQLLNTMMGGDDSEG